jgi:mRNA-degrading endonuclease RelE of RelBE toxin-antitoxin system
MVEVQLTPEASHDLAQLPATIQVRALKIIQRLRQWPDVSGAKPLRHGLAGRFRVRTGDYRIQFFLKSAVLVIEKIGHRDGFYEE